jgi:hypothetical protein
MPTSGVIALPPTPRRSTSKAEQCRRQEARMQRSGVRSPVRGRLIQTLPLAVQPGSPSRLVCMWIRRMARCTSLKIRQQATVADADARGLRPWCRNSGKRRVVTLLPITRADADTVSPHFPTASLCGSVQAGLCQHLGDSYVLKRPAHALASFSFTGFVPSVFWRQEITRIRKRLRRWHSFFQKLG